MCLWTVNVCKFVLLIATYLDNTTTRYASSWCPPSLRAHDACGIADVQHGAESARDAILDMAHDAAVLLGVVPPIESAPSPVPVGVPIGQDDVPLLSPHSAHDARLPHLSDVGRSVRTTSITTRLSADAEIVSNSSVDPSLSSVLMTLRLITEVFAQANIAISRSKASPLPAALRADGGVCVANVSSTSHSHSIPPYRGDVVHFDVLRFVHDIPWHTRSTDFHTCARSQGMMSALLLENELALCEVHTSNASMALEVYAHPTSRQMLYDFVVVVAELVTELSRDASGVFASSIAMLRGIDLSLLHHTEVPCLASRVNEYFVSLREGANSVLKIFRESRLFSRLSKYFHASTAFVTSAGQLASAMSMSLDQVASGRPAMSLLTGGWQYVVVGRDMLTSSAVLWLWWMRSLLCDYATFAAACVSHSVSAIYNPLQLTVGWQYVVVGRDMVTSSAVSWLWWMRSIVCDYAMVVAAYVSHTVSAIYNPLHSLASTSVTLATGCLSAGAVAAVSCATLAAEFATATFVSLSSDTVAALRTVMRHSSSIGGAFVVVALAPICVDIAQKLGASFVDWWWLTSTLYYVDALESLPEWIGGQACALFRGIFEPIVCVARDFALLATVMASRSLRIVLQVAATVSGTPVFMYQLCVISWQAFKATPSATMRCAATSWRSCTALYVLLSDSITACCVMCLTSCKDFCVHLLGRKFDPHRSNGILLRFNKLVAAVAACLGAYAAFFGTEEVPASAISCGVVCLGCLFLVDVVAYVSAAIRLHEAMHPSSWGKIPEDDGYVATMSLQTPDVREIFQWDARTTSRWMLAQLPEELRVDVYERYGHQWTGAELLNLDLKEPCAYQEFEFIADEIARRNMIEKIEFLQRQSLEPVHGRRITLWDVPLPSHAILHAQSTDGMWRSILFRDVKDQVYKATSGDARDVEWDSPLRLAFPLARWCSMRNLEVGSYALVKPLHAIEDNGKSATVCGRVLEVATDTKVLIEYNLMGERRAFWHMSSDIVSVPYFSPRQFENELQPMQVSPNCVLEMPRGTEVDCRSLSGGWWTTVTIDDFFDIELYREFAVARTRAGRDYRPAGFPFEVSSKVFARRDRREVWLVCEVVAIRGMYLKVTCQDERLDRDRDFWVTADDMREVRLAKGFVKSALLQKHDICQLKRGDRVDCRTMYGKWLTCCIRWSGYCDTSDVWRFELDLEESNREPLELTSHSDELYRLFADARSLARRNADDDAPVLRRGTLVAVRPNFGSEWREGRIVEVNGSQIKVVYTDADVKICHWWASYDDACEIRPLVNGALLLSPPLVRDTPLDVRRPLLCPRRSRDVPPPIEAPPMSAGRLSLPIKMSEDSDPVSVFRIAEARGEETPSPASEEKTTSLPESEERVASPASEETLSPVSDERVPSSASEERAPSLVIEERAPSPVSEEMVASPASEEKTLLSEETLVVDVRMPLPVSTQKTPSSAPSAPIDRAPLDLEEMPLVEASLRMSDEKERDALPAESERETSFDHDRPLVPDMKVSPLADAETPSSPREETPMAGNGDENTSVAPSSDKMPSAVADDAPTLPSSDAATQKKPLEAFVFWLGSDEKSAIEGSSLVPASTSTDSTRSMGSGPKQVSSENSEAPSRSRAKRQRSAPMGVGANPTSVLQVAQGFGHQQKSSPMFGAAQLFSRPKNQRSRVASRSARRSTRDRGDTFALMSDSQTSSRSGGKRLPPPFGGNQKPSLFGGQWAIELSGGQLTAASLNLQQSPFGGQQTPSPFGGRQTPALFAEQPAPSPFGTKQTHSALGTQEVPSALGRQQTPFSFGGQQTLVPFGGQSALASGQPPPSPFGEKQRHPQFGAPQAPSVPGKQKAPFSLGAQAAPSSFGGKQAPALLGVQEIASPFDSKQAHSALGDVQAPSALGGQQVPFSFGGQPASSPFGTKQTHSALGTQEVSSTLGRQQTPFSFGGQHTPVSFGGQSALLGGQPLPSPFGKKQRHHAFGARQAPSALGGQQAPFSFGAQPAPSSFGGKQKPALLGRQPMASSFDGMETHSAFGVPQASSALGGQQASFSFGKQPASSLSGAKQTHSTLGALEVPFALDGLQTPFSFGGKQTPAPFSSQPTRSGDQSTRSPFSEKHAHRAFGAQHVPSAVGEHQTPFGGQSTPSSFDGNQNLAIFGGQHRPLKFGSQQMSPLLGDTEMPQSLSPDSVSRVPLQSSVAPAGAQQHASQPSTPTSSRDGPATLVASTQKSVSTAQQAAATSSLQRSFGGADLAAQSSPKSSTQTDDFLFDLLETIEAEDCTRASPLASTRISDVVNGGSLSDMNSAFDELYGSQASLGGFNSFDLSMPLPEDPNADSDELVSLSEFDSSNDDAANASADEAISDEDRELREIQQLLDTGDY